MKAETLKKAILQYAMQGKLVEQNPNDEPASELLKRIKAQKEELIKQGKIKKEKPLTPITEDEKPFIIPDSWTWCRVSDIGIYKKGPFGSTLTKKIFVPRGNDTIKVYEQKNAIQKDATLGNYYISKEYYEKSMKNFKVSAGDVIVSCAGTIGETYVMPDNIELGIINQALMRMTITKDINIKYFLMYFDIILKKDSKTYSKGSAIKNIPPFDIFKKMLIPLPPLAEQQRIVDKLEEILPLVEEYGKNEEELEKLNKTLPDKIKQSILQHAVQGKLVPQNPNDKPASELLKRIKVQKEELIKQGKIKKEKPLPSITQDEIPFELPKDWEWVRLGEIATINRGVTPQYSNNSKYKFINQKCVRWGSIELEHCKFVTEESFNKFDKNKLIKTNDLLINSTGEGTIGRCSTINTEALGLPFDSHVLSISPIFCINIYIEKFINCIYGQNQIKEVKGAKTTKQTELGVEKTRNIIIPLPPLAEQQQIVAKVNELMQLCEELENKNNIIQKSSSELLQSIMQTVFSKKESLRGEIIDLKLKRTILSAEIIFQLHNEQNFGAIKLEKILYLCETHLKINLAGNYKKEVAGPHDAQARYEVEDILKNKKWFDVKKEQKGNIQVTKYTPLEKNNEITDIFNKVFSAETIEINNLLELFRGKNSDFCEAIATLYAVWKNRLNNNLSCTDAELISDFKNWSKSKERFYDSDLRDRILFMRRKNLTPDSNIKK